MRFWAATLLCAATGCAQIFGLDTTSSGADANLDRTSLQLTRVSIGAGVVRNPYDMSMQTAKFYADDGAGGYTVVDGVNGPVDTFTAPINVGTPPVLFTTPDMSTHFWALPSRVQKSNLIVYEHPNPVAAEATSAVMVAITLPTAWVAAESFQLLVVGAWTQHGMTAAELPAIGPDMGATTISSTVPYTAFTNVFGGATKSSFNANDVVLFLRYTSGILSGVFQAPPMDQTAGTDPVSGTLTNVPATKTLNVTIDPTGYGTRYAAVRPATTGLAMSWRLGACPGWKVAADSGCVRLNSGGASMTNTAITAMYGNPFEGLDWKTVLTFSTSVSRTATFNGAMIGLSSAMTTVTEPAMGQVLDLPAGLPETVRANLLNLTSDGMSLTLDLTKPIAIDAINDKPTSAPSLYGMSLVEIDAVGAKKLVLDAITQGDPVFKLPPEFLQDGHSYYIEYRIYSGGFTDAASGDTTTVTLPYTSAMLDSGIFTVVAQ